MDLEIHREIFWEGLKATNDNDRLGVSINSRFE